MRVFSQEESSSSSLSSSGLTWQQRVLLASQYVALDGVSQELGSTSTTNNREAFELFGPIDNTSHQCPSWHLQGDGFCVPCPDDKPLWWLVLRWLKIMLLKIARSYHAKPLILVIAPLVIGMCLGYWLGITRGRQQRKEEIRQVSFLSAAMNRLSEMSSLLSFYLASKRIEQQLRNTQFQNGRTESLQSYNDNKAALSVGDTSTIHGAASASIDDSEFENSVEEARVRLKSDVGTVRESDVDIDKVPQHVAVILDGNRRYGLAKYGNASKGHWDGAAKLLEFTKWCLAENVSVVTVYAFSTENWNREKVEVDMLMKIFSRMCAELETLARENNIKVIVLSTDSDKIPTNVKEDFQRLVDETKDCTGITMNICMSYGGRSEIVCAARSIANDVNRGLLDANSITEQKFGQRLLTKHCMDPDVLIRTSGQVRISNFLLWQLAYTEMFFIQKPWPEIEKKDLLNVIESYANCRVRRFGK